MQDILNSILDLQIQMADLLIWICDALEEMGEERDREVSRREETPTVH